MRHARDPQPVPEAGKGDKKMRDSFRNPAFLYIA